MVFGNVFDCERRSISCFSRRSKVFSMVPFRSRLDAYVVGATRARARVYELGSPSGGSSRSLPGGWAFAQTRRPAPEVVTRASRAHRVHDGVCLRGGRHCRGSPPPRTTRRSLSAGCRDLCVGSMFGESGDAARWGRRPVGHRSRRPYGWVLAFVSLPPCSSVGEVVGGWGDWEGGGCWGGGGRVGWGGRWWVWGGVGAVFGWWLGGGFGMVCCVGWGGGGR